MRLCPKIDKKRPNIKKEGQKVCYFAKTSYLCTRLTAHEVDSLAQQVEHIPFKDGVLGSSPKRITERRIANLAVLLFFVSYKTCTFILIHH